MKVYRSHFASKVHFDPECPAWKRATHSLEAVELADLKAAKFCRTCSPAELHDRPRTHHSVCTKCGWKRPMPCAHNGGVPVVNVDELEHYGQIKRRVNVRWRWPENVIGATVADVTGS